VQCFPKPILNSFKEIDPLPNKLSLVALLILMMSASLFAQIQPSARESSSSLSVGGELSTFNPDWGCSSNSPLACWNHQLLGFGVYVDANRIIQKFGAEGEARWLHWRGPGAGLVESSYLLGPRYEFIHHGKLAVYGKVLMGGGWITLSNDIGKGSYFAFAPGGTVEYKLSKQFTLRGDYEYQMWPAFSGVTSLGNNGLTPNGLSFGVSYRIHRK